MSFWTSPGAIAGDRRVSSVTAMDGLEGTNMGEFMVDFLGDGLEKTWGIDGT